MFSVVNEALISTIGHDPMTSLYVSSSSPFWLRPLISCSLAFCCPLTIRLGACMRWTMTYLGDYGGLSR